MRLQEENGDFFRGETTGVTMDLDFVAASPGSRWMDESAVRRRQQRLLSSPLLRTHLTPAFDAVAGGADGMSPYSGSASSSGGLDLGFDSSLLRYRRACFSATAELDQRRLLYSPQWLQGAPMYSVVKHQADGMSGAPGSQDFRDISSVISPWQSSADRPTATARGISNKPAADLRSGEDTVIQATKAELSTPQPEVAPPAQPASSAQAEQPTEEDEELIAEVLYGESGRRRLPVFKIICPE
ncbi:hypothetical protein ABZP36_001519 [Zizania latifolia]